LNSRWVLRSSPRVGKLAQFIDNIVFYTADKFQRKIIICKIVMIFFLTAEKFSLD
jgi:hypothetical protein